MYDNLVLKCYMLFYLVLCFVSSYHLTRGTKAKIAFVYHHHTHLYLDHRILDYHYKCCKFHIVIMVIMEEKVVDLVAWAETMEKAVAIEMDLVAHMGLRKEDHMEQ